MSNSILDSQYASPNALLTSHGFPVNTSGNTVLLSHSPAGTYPDPGGDDTQPAAFSFGTNPTGLALSAGTQTSDAATITDITAASAFTFSGTDGSCEWRKNGGSWVTTGSGSCVDGDTLQLRHTAGTGYSQTVSGTITFTSGPVSATFSSTTVAIDTTPAAIDFGSRTNQTRSATNIESPNTVTVLEVTAATPITFNFTGSGQWQKNGGSWSSAASDTAVLNDTLKLRHNISASYGGVVTSTITFVPSGVTSTFTTTAEAEDTYPDLFDFADISGTVALSSVQQSIATITVAGINAAAAITISGSGGSAHEYQKNGGSWTSSAGTVVLGDTVRVRHTSSGSNSTPATTTLTIGGRSDTFTSTTVASGEDLTDYGIATLEIIQPRAGLTTANRFYKAYPNLLYEVQIAAIGGTYPNTYELTTAPSGMTVNANTGIISWPNPPASGTPYSVTARVTDKIGAQASVTWTVLVTTSGFRFMDASASSGGTGLIGSPWNSIDDWYLTKYDATYQGEFLYIRAGTYATLDAPLEDGTRMALPNNKPLVWLAYPGDARPVIDLTDSYIAAYSDTTNMYFDGIEFAHLNTRHGITIDSGGTDNTFRKCRFSDISTAFGPGQNVSCLFFMDNSEGLYTAIVDNVFTQVYDAGYGVLIYDQTKMLVMRNTVSDFTHSEGKGIGPKRDNTLVFIRDNRIDMANGQGVWIDTWGGVSESIEVAYNLVDVTEASGGDAFELGREGEAHGLIASYRNTYVGAVDIANLSIGSGPVTFTNDVMVNTGSGVTYSNSHTLNAVTTGLLTGTAATGIVDANGNLTGAYTVHVGAKGYQQP